MAAAIATVTAMIADPALRRTTWTACFRAIINGELEHAELLKSPGAINFFERLKGPGCNMPVFTAADKRVLGWSED
jgi:hypothetical protein